MKDLSYYISLMEKGMEHSPYSVPKTASELWDHRALSWAHEWKSSRKTHERQEKDLLFLERNGVLRKDFSVADIGCGPGHFAAAFASRVRFVAAFDISSQMISQGKAYAEGLNLHNIRFYVRDFDALDLKAEGFANAFDLVFCSLTPAVRSFSHLLKAMEMSRRYCCCISHLYRKNRLMEQIMSDCFPDQSMNPQPDGSWFHAALHVLLLMGYKPQTSYEPRHSEKRIVPDQEYLDFLLEKMFLPIDRTQKNRDTVMDWLMAHTEKNGFITEITDSCYGRLLWEVKK